MANLSNVFTKILIFCFGFCSVCIVLIECRPANNAGTVTQTTVRHFQFFARIANPCEIAPAQQNTNSPHIQQTPLRSTAHGNRTTNVMSSSSSRIQFYQTMALILELVQSKLRLLEDADPTLPECNGITLDSLPTTPQLDKLTVSETITQAYKSGIFLAAHFHLMAMDRRQPISDQEVQLEEDEVPSWRFQRCGNESDQLQARLDDVTTEMESVVCTILSSATLEQRASFRTPFNKLNDTVLERYDTCTMRIARDCLIVREAKQATSLILRKFASLITEEANRSANTNESNVSGDSEEMDNFL